MVDAEEACVVAGGDEDVVGADGTALAAIPSDRVADIRLAVHPSLRVVRSQFPALTIWRMNVDDGVPEPVDLESGWEDALVLRSVVEVEVRSMPPGGAEFVTALANGQTATEATRSAMGASARFDLSANFAALIGAGAFVGYSLVDDEIRREITEGRT